MANKTTERLAPADRKSSLLALAVALAKKKGLKAVTRDAVAAAAEVTPALINHYFGNANTLRWEALQVCAAERDEKVIASALVMGYQVSDVKPLVSREVWRKALALVPENVEMMP